MCALKPCIHFPARLAALGHPPKHVKNLTGIMPPDARALTTAFSFIVIRLPAMTEFLKSHVTIDAGTKLTTFRFARVMCTDSNISFVVALHHRPSLLVFTYLTRLSLIFEPDPSSFKHNVRTIGTFLRYYTIGPTAISCLEKKKSIESGTGIS